MPNILSTLPTIELLKGSHSDMGSTGRGCFMNVIAYLNNEPVITDKSECVCVTVRRVAIWLNDYLSDGERHVMLPFLLRAMGSATADPQVLATRRARLVKFARTNADIAADAAAYAADAAADAAAYAADAADAAADAAAYAADAAAYAAAYAANAAAYAAANAPNAAAYAANAAANAADAAAAAADAAADYEAGRKKIIDTALQYLDEVLPQIDAPTQDVQKRIERLVEVASC